MSFASITFQNKAVNSGYKQVKTRFASFPLLSRQSPKSLARGLWLIVRVKKAASGCDFDVNVFYNRMIIDAKSLLGVLSLDLTKILTVEYDGENAPFEAFLERKNPMHAVA